VLRPKVVDEGVERRRRQVELVELLNHLVAEGVEGGRRRAPARRCRLLAERREQTLDRLARGRDERRLARRAGRLRASLGSLVGSLARALQADDGTLARTERSTDLPLDLGDLERRSGRGWVECGSRVRLAGGRERGVALKERRSCWKNLDCAELSAVPPERKRKESWPSCWWMKTHRLADWS